MSKLRPAKLRFERPTVRAVEVGATRVLLRNKYLYSATFVLASPSDFWIQLNLVGNQSKLVGSPTKITLGGKSSKLNTCTHVINFPQMPKKSLQRKDFFHICRICKKLVQVFYFDAFPPHRATVRTKVAEQVPDRTGMLQLALF